MQQSKVYIGTISFGALTAPYIDYFKEAIDAQSFQGAQLLIHDNTEVNLGFSKAYNLLINKARSAAADYFLVINPDVYLEPTALEKMIAELEANPKLGSVAPKLLRWDFANKKFTQTIDSCGLAQKSGLYFYDIGQGEKDAGQYDQARIIGPSGAAGLYRMSALEAVAEQGQYFDEDFFMYKEDCDLAYRLKQSGFESKLISNAIGYHDRTASGGSILERVAGRKKRSVNVNLWSFMNQHFLFIKHWRSENALSKIDILLRAALLGLYALVFEQALLLSYKTIYGFLCRYRFLER